MFKANFYVGEDALAPVGEKTFWIPAVPRMGETVTVTYNLPGLVKDQRHITGEVISVQWLVGPGDGLGPDSCTVDVTLRGLPAPESAEPSLAPYEAR